MTGNFVNKEREKAIMITIQAFKALRPKEEWVQEVAALPYDVMTLEEARRMTKEHPYSFLNIDKPEIHVTAQGDAPYIYARNKLDEFIENNIFVEEDECMYIYELETLHNHQYGLACMISTKDYDENRIKKHENTRTDKEEDRVSHILHCEAHTGPIFLVENEWDEFGDFLCQYTKSHSPLYDFKLEDHVTHRLYAIKDSETLTYLKEAFKHIDTLYIADGHHRAAAAAKVGRMVGDSKPEAQHFLSVIFPKEQLRILPYHRIIKDESGYTKDKLFEKISQFFDISDVGTSVYLPSKEHQFGMRYQKHWYKLEFKSHLLRDHNAVSNLDVTILQNFILDPLFNIRDPKQDTRIDFIPGSNHIEVLNERTENEMDIAFSLFPTSIESLIAVAKAGDLMPPKSTWFEPKLRSGLLIHKF